jgi:hypothetical protein
LPRPRSGRPAGSPRPGQPANEDAAEIATALTHVEQLPVFDLDQLAAQLADLGQTVLVRAENRVRDMLGMGDVDSWSLG